MTALSDFLARPDEAETCPVCGDTLPAPKEYPRDRIVLHDETDGSVGHVVRRLCGTCWLEFYTVVTGPPPQDPDHEPAEHPGGEGA